MADAAVQVSDLRKSYGTLEAVAGIDLSIARGEVFALLGPNGAGKTTTVEILEGHRHRSGGEVSVLGHDPARGEREFRQRIGIVLQSTGVEPYLTVAESVALYGGYYPHPRSVDEVIDLVGLAEQRDRRIGKLSGGQRRRVDLAIALAGDPELLFLDEPTTGFDPAARRQAWEMVRGLAALGKTIFLTTHFMDEAQALADRVAIIASGRIVAEGTPESLGGRASAVTRLRFSVPPGTTLPERFAASRIGSAFELTTAEPTGLLYDLTGWAIGEGIELEGLEAVRPSLEDAYLRLTGASDENDEGAPEAAE
jgi:ABC-2 type transport system ATP-binding protein